MDGSFHSRVDLIFSPRPAEVSYSLSSFTKKKLREFFRPPSSLVLLATLFIHAAALWQLNAQSLPVPKPVYERLLVLEFMDKPSVEKISEVARPAAKPAQSKKRVLPTPAASVRATSNQKIADELSVFVEPTTKTTGDTPLRLHSLDGSLELPDDLLTQIDEKTGVGKSFDYEIKGVATAGEFMRRPQVLEYQSTRFEEYWQPTDNVLTELLTKALEMTSVRIKIPNPSNPNSHIECVVVVLAAGGGCGIVKHGNGYLVQLDDPETLDEDEAKQCEILWDHIVSADRQEDLRKSQKIYEQHCRKPLEKLTR